MKYNFMENFVDALYPTTSNPFFELGLPDGRKYISPRDLIVGRDPCLNPNRHFLKLIDARISREHALFTLTPKGVVISDTHSRNGIYIGNQRIKEPQILAKGDRITLAGRLNYNNGIREVKGGYPLEFLGYYS